MLEYEAKDYSLFDEGASTIESSKDKLTTMLESANSEINKMCGSNFLVGKAAESLTDAWQKESKEAVEKVADLTNYSNYLIETANNYAKTDSTVGKDINGV